MTSTLGILTGPLPPPGNLTSLPAGNGLPSWSIRVRSTGTIVGTGTLSRVGGPGGRIGCGTGTPPGPNTTGNEIVVAFDCVASPTVNWNPRKSLPSRTIPAALISSSVSGRVLTEVIST